MVAQFSTGILAHFSISIYKEWGCAGPDYHFSVFKRHPEWIKESHDLGMKVNAWTINDAKDMKWLIDHGVDFITTNVPVELQEILQ